MIVGLLLKIANIELFTIDYHLLMTDYIDISTKVIISSGQCLL